MDAMDITSTSGGEIKRSLRGTKINVGAAHSRGNDIMMQSEIIKSMQAPVNLHSGPSQGNIDRYKRISVSKADRVDEHVFIGNNDAASDLEWITSTGIGYVVNCAKELPNYHKSLVYVRLDLGDGQDEKGTDDDLYRVVEGAYRYIVNIIKRTPNAKILVHCAAGISRSASIVVYYLMRKNGMGYDQALKHLRDARPIVSPNQWYERQLRDIDALRSSSKK